MDFRPQAGEVITIEQPFVFMPHPAAPDFPYGQSGRRGTVYQVMLDGASGAGSDHPFHALKVFSEFFQDQRNSETAQRLISCAGMPGLEACYRKVIVPNLYPNLIQKYPQLAYAVLMPWVNGETWFDIIFGCQTLTPDQSFGLARELVRCLVELEKRKMAHCDLSGANILVQPEILKVAMVDVEEMYIPGLPPLDEKKKPAGTPGYGHKTARAGLWCPEADRFAGAVLLGEILGWCSEKVRQTACEAQYFDINEVQTVCSRYRVLNDALRRQWGSPISDLFSRAWFSDKLTDCPTFESWWSALMIATPTGENTGTPREDDPRHFAQALITSQPAQAELEQVYQPADPWASIDTPLTGSQFPNRSPLRQHSPRKFLSNWQIQLPASRRMMVLALVIVLLLGLGAGGAAWTLTPHGSTTLQGQVQNSQNGKPLKAHIELKGAGWPVTQNADAQGVYRFVNIPGAPAKITVSMPGYQTVTTNVQVPDSGTKQLDPIQLHMTGGGIAGKVLNPDTGAGLDGAQVILAGTYQISSKTFSQTFTTGATGEFEFLLEDGFQAELTIKKSGYQTTQWPTTIKVSPGQQPYLPGITVKKLK